MRSALDTDRIGQNIRINRLDMAACDRIADEVESQYPDFIHKYVLFERFNGKDWVPVLLSELE